ncbi:MAG: DUF1573 domain-containing protein [bacterium]|nr:DUF1573 domain-containing protein [bacterium]
MRKPDLKKAIGLLCLIALCPFTAASQTGLFSPDPVHDFGSIGFDLEVFHEYPVVNGTSKTIEIVACKVTCDCSHATISDTSLAPGDTAVVRLSFATTDYYGPSSKAIRLETSDPDYPKLELYYKAQIGQWRYNVRPEPVSLFYLPGKGAKKATLVNNELEFINIREIEPLDDLFSVEVISDKASKGESVEMVVTPKEGLASGTYLSNFEVTLDAPDGLGSFVITIPVKIVRY